MLVTQRLLLRPHADTDIDFMMELNSDPDVIRYTGDAAFENRAEAQAVIERLKSQFAEKRMGRFIVLDKLTHEPLGWCGLRWFEKEREVDLGYRFMKKHWGKGYATEASKACLDYGFNTLKLAVIYASVAEENHASIRVLEKLGFQDTGTTVCGHHPAKRYVIRNRNT